MFQAAPSQDFINETTIATLGGATTAVVVVSVVLRRVFGVNHPGVPLMMALLISFGLAFDADSLDTAMGWLLALVNACLLFCAAIGANETLVELKTGRPVGEARQQGRRRLPFVTSYFAH